MTDVAEQGSQIDFGLPLLVEIEPTETCNLRCRMCHVSYLPEESKFILNPNLVKKLACLGDAHIIIGSGFEPLMNRGFADIIRHLTKIGSSLEITTNGTLLDGDLRNILADANLRIMNFSFDGIRKETFEYIRRRAHFEPIIENILAMRQRFVGRDTYFAVNSTMMRRNMNEVGEILQFWDAADFDLLRLLFMVVRAPDQELARESLYPIREEFYRLLDEAALNVITAKRRIGLRSPYYAQSPLRTQHPNAFRNDMVLSEHPGARVVPTPRQEHQQGIFPGMGFPCRSPFTFARILPTGDVQLCYQFTIGNLAEGSFEDIWFGERAKAVRAKLMADRQTCESCDYYRFCISSDRIDVNDKEQYFSKRLMSLADVMLKPETQDLSQMDVAAFPPRLIESVGSLNIVEYKAKFYIIPQSAGSHDLQKIDPMSLPGVRRTDTLKRARLLTAQG